jgi:hypothetical protein
VSIEYFRLGPESFSGISRGLGLNSTLESFSLVGNLMTWNDLLGFCSEIQFNNKLAIVDFTKNALSKALTQLENEKLLKIFENLSKANLKSFKIDSFFWDYKTYPFKNFQAFEDSRTKFA